MAKKKYNKPLKINTNFEDAISSLLSKNSSKKKLHKNRPLVTTNYSDALKHLPEYMNLKDFKYHDSRSGKTRKIIDVIVAPTADGIYGNFMILSRDMKSYSKAAEHFKDELFTIRCILDGENNNEAFPETREVAEVMKDLENSLGIHE